MARGITSLYRWSINCPTVFSLFLHVGQPGTCTPLPPCPIEGGVSTKKSKVCFCSSAWTAAIMVSALGP